MTKPELIRTWMFALYDTGFYAEHEVAELNSIDFLGHPDIVNRVTCDDNNIYTMLFTHKGTFEQFAEKYGLAVRDVIKMYTFILQVFDRLLSQSVEAKQRRLLNAYKALYNLNLDYDRDGENIFVAISGVMTDVVYASVILGQSIYEIEREYDKDEVMIKEALCITNSRMWECHVRNLTPYNKPLHLKCVKEGMVPLQPTSVPGNQLADISLRMRSDVPVF